ncbi:DUF485 domain-containing protein [uncultured Georgenia sp.]|uniref:DUF485 domain-containing protein n=1 Tax=uncultured Georgenia sp. TaxID=378209 RepID=UPI002612E32A|nr:DUF485 domain-containing protein [uncultured Georgenia sp.]HLV04201.1 DUF485 domain-containing protein [Actinomycetaceae bacterium]
MTQPDPQDRPPGGDARPGLTTGLRQPTAAELRAVQASEDFGRLRRSFRVFAFPMTAAFFVWYLSYVLLSTYAGDLLSVDVVGNLNIGLLFGLAQFATTFLITWLYIRHANRSLDPIAGRLRTELEGDE